MKNKLFTILFIGIAFSMSAQSVDPLRTKDVEAQNTWVDSIVKNMTLDQKIGQLFMVQAYSNLDQKHEDFIIEMIKKYDIGSLIFMQGTPKKQAELNNK